jgi:hypothetical protein
VVVGTAGKEVHVMLADLEEKSDRRVVELLRIQNVSDRRNNSFRLRLTGFRLKAFRLQFLWKV